MNKYLEFILINMKSFKPLIIKKYLKDVYNSVLNSIFLLG